jgi:RHS repeat-associated protein
MVLAVADGRVWFDRAGKRTCDLPNSAPLTQFATNEVVWFDDALPSGAQSGTWTWDTAVKASGTQSHVALPTAGNSEHYFFNATATITSGTGDTLFTYAYIDPCNPPRSIMLAWNDGSWDHRAYWGEDLIGGAARQHIGPIPAATGWVRLDVPAATVNLGGRTISGMSFVTHSGRAWFDRTGVATCGFAAPAQPTFGANDVVWFDDAPPSGANAVGITWTSAQKASGTHAIVGDGSSTPYDVWFDSSPTITPASNDVIVAYVLIDPCAPPREIAFAWSDGSWDHRAYWGEDLAPVGTIRIHMGDIPAAGEWVRLEIPAASLNLAGQAIRGMGFYVHSGRAWFDRVGIAPAPSNVRSETWRNQLPSMMSASSAAPLTTTSTTPLRRYSLYTPELQLMAETELTTSATPAIAYEYLWFAGQPVAQIETATNTVHYYFNDHLGTPILTTDATGTVDWRIEREPYGEPYAIRTGADRHQPLSFPGQEDDVEGERSYNVFRWYRSGWGRYTQADPIGFRGSENLFSYAEASPNNLIDPEGLEAISLFEKLNCVSNPLGCYAGKKCWKEAFAATKGKYIKQIDGTPSNAYLHCYLSCCMTKIAGKNTAKNVLDLHESKPSNKQCMKNMDLHNNKVGQGSGFYGPSGAAIATVMITRTCRSGRRAIATPVAI